MFIGFYRLNNEEHFDIYYKNIYGYDEWRKDTFSPLVKDIECLDLKVSGNTYQERKENARELSVDWQLNFSSLDWSYGELATINEYFHKVGKQYGLLKEFKENGIC